MISQKQIVEIARIKLPLVVATLTQANLEAQKAKPDLDKLRDLLAADVMDGFYDVSDLLDAYHKLASYTAPQGDKEQA